MSQRIPALALVAPVAVAAAVSIRAQTPGSGYTTSTTAVIVDVVVRDAKSMPIVDLKPSDFELLEDDVKQRIASVELIAPGPNRAARTAAAPAGQAAATGQLATGDAGRANAVPAPARPATAIALVFHRLSADGRALASRAARGYLERSAQPNDYAGVFVIDTRLETLQAFTTDATKLAAAIERAAVTQAADTARHQPMSTLFGDASPDVSPTASAESVGRPIGESGFVPRAQAPSASAANPREDTQGRIQRLSEHMERAYEEMMRDRNGNAESAALTAVVTAMGSLPGRKAVVLFSEGVSVPDTLEAKFRAVVDTANRGNVTIYAIDAKGLRLHSEQAAIRARPRRAARRRRRRSAPGDGRRAGPPQLAHGRPRARRVPAEQGPRGESRHAGEGDRRLPDRRHQRPFLGVPAHRRGPALPLPADLHAGEPVAGR